MKPAVRLALVALLAIAAGLTWRTCQPRSGSITDPGPAGSSVNPSASAPGSTAAALAVLGRCDQQPQPPDLPTTLGPVPTDLPGVISALDATLNDAQKTWLRCFDDDGEILARTHFGLARWLSTQLHLRTQPALITALGAKSPDEASSIVVIAYVHHLRGEALTPAQAAERRTRALEAAGVTP